MKNFNSKVLLGLALLTGALSSEAQLHPPKFGSTTAPNNFYKDYVGVGLDVTQPSIIAGPKVYTLANEGTGATGDWGGTITTSMLDKELVKATPDSLGCIIPTNSMAGKVAFIFRGDCEFGAKALAAQNAGAIATIIVNNIPGGPVGMGAGAQGGSVTIPVFMISQEDGVVINNRINAGDIVKVSITTWGNGKTHDLGILYNGISLWHSYAVPKSQMGINNGNPTAYKGYDGAFIGNFGFSTETDVQLKSTLNFTADGSTIPQLLRKDSVSFSSFPVSDSIIAIGMNNSYDVHPVAPAQKGRFDVNYTVSASSFDEFLGNNSVSYSYYVTDSLFSKGRYDFTKNEPIANTFVQLTGGTPYMVGNLYHVAIGNFAALSSQFTISKNGSLLDNVISTLLIYKWTDTAVQDSLMQVGEMELVGIGTYAFNNGDSSGKIYSVSYESTLGAPGSPVVLDSNSWYYVAAVTPGDCFLGFDGILNRYPRTYLRQHATTNPYTEFYTTLYGGNENDLIDDQSNNPLLTNTMFAFERGAITTNEAVDSARFAQQKSGYVPAITLKISPATVGIPTTNSNVSKIEYFPNPASTELNVNISFDQKVATANYMVLDITGKQLKKVTHNNVSIDKVRFETSGLSSGIYFLVVNADNKTTVRKFIVK